MGEALRDQTCPWTCLSGTSVSPPHPCIQNPVLTGTRRGRNVSHPGGQARFHPPSSSALGPAWDPAPNLVLNMQIHGHSSSGKDLLRLAFPLSLWQNAQECNSDKRAIILTPHPVNWQSVWAVSAGYAHDGEHPAVTGQSCCGQSLPMAKLVGLEMRNTPSSQEQ